MNGDFDEIRLHSTDLSVNQLIKSLDERGGAYTAHYDQNEDFFVKLANEFTVPHFAVHHDVNLDRPGKAYQRALLRLVEQLAVLLPQLLRGLSYAFDPADPLRAAFFQLFKIGELHYLYLLKLDMRIHPHDAQVVEPGTNDLTAAYRTNKLFLEATIIPIVEFRNSEGEGAISFIIKHTLSSTWIGESGRGYRVQGVWIDQDLTKFFSKLFVPQGVRHYPYYPFVCRHRTICHTVIDLSPDGRKRYVPNLHRALEFLTPHMPAIENALRTSEFSDTLPVFQAIKKRVPGYWSEVFSALKVTAYLNEVDMKEFLVET